MNTEYFRWRRRYCSRCRCRPRMIQKCAILNTHSNFYSFGDDDDDDEEMRKETFTRSRALISSSKFFFLLALAAVAAVVVRRTQIQMIGFFTKKILILFLGPFALSLLDSCFLFYEGPARACHRNSRTVRIFVVVAVCALVLEIGRFIVTTIRFRSSYFRQSRPRNDNIKANQNETKRRSNDK